MILDLWYYITDYTILDLYFSPIVFVTTVWMILSLLIFRNSYFSAFLKMFKFSKSAVKKEALRFFVPHYAIILWGISLFIYTYNGMPAWVGSRSAFSGDISDFVYMFLPAYLIITFLPVLALEIRVYRSTKQSWFGIFTPLINFIYILFLNKREFFTTDKNNDKRLNTEPETESDTICCSFCANKNPADAVFCNKCGKKISMALSNDSDEIDEITIEDEKLNLQEFVSFVPLTKKQIKSLNARLK